MRQAQLSPQAAQARALSQRSGGSKGIAWGSSRVHLSALILGQGNLRHCRRYAIGARTLPARGTRNREKIAAADRRYFAPRRIPHIAPTPSAGPIARMHSRFGQPINDATTGVACTVRIVSAKPIAV